VNVPSVFRVYTESIRVVDIDFQLFQDDIEVAISNSTFGWEEIGIQLQTDSNYLFVVSYWITLAQLLPCATWNLELAIEPAGQLSNCDQDQIPVPDDFIPSAKTDLWSNTSVFRFQQRNRANSFYLDFNVTQELYFRTQIRYEFIFSDLRLSLFQLFPPRSIATGQSGINSESISVVVLSPGSYHLLINEPRRVTNNTNHCVSFQLLVALSPTSATANQTNDDCEEMRFPGSINNNIQYLSPLSGPLFHIFSKYSLASRQV